MLSVICPVRDEEKYIDACIESILSQDYPRDDMEVIFADGMSTDRTREIIASYAERHPFIRIIDNPDRVVPPAMNRAIRASRGEVIIRLDAHAGYEPDYFSVLVRGLDRYGADNIGAVCHTDVPCKTPKSMAIKEILSHPLGVGNSTFRTGADRPVETDTVPFGCWRREVFDKYGLFDERLVRNQDIELNSRILRGGGRIILTPETHCTYYARDTFSKLAKNNFANGKWNIFTVLYTGRFRSLSLRHFIPLIFLLSLLLPAIGAIFFRPLIWIAVASAAAYMTAIGTASAMLARRRHLNFFYTFATFAVLHLSYGLGSLVGLLKAPFIKK